MAVPPSAPLSDLEKSHLETVPPPPPPPPPPEPASDLEKLRLEMKQLSLENQKLEIELRRLHHPWLRDPDTLLKLITGMFVFLGAVGTAYYTGLTGTVNRLRFDQEELKTSNARLDADNKKLELDKRKLEAGNVSLLKANDSLKKNLESVELESDIQLLRHNARWKGFSSSPQQSPVIEPIATVIQYVQHHPQRREENISYLEAKEAASQDLSETAALDLALFGITGETRFRHRLAAIFIQSHENLLGLKQRSDLSVNFLIGLGVSGWGSKEKTEFSLDVLANTTGKGSELQLGVINELRRIWSGDSKLAMTNPKTAPVLLAAIALNREAALNKTNKILARHGALAELYEWSPEAFLAVIAKTLSDPTLDKFDREVIGDLVPLARQNDAHGVTDRPDGTEASDWKAWLEDDENTEFVEPYLEPKLNTLRVRLEHPISARIH